jgi:hypothetical protein
MPTEPSLGCPRKLLKPSLRFVFELAEKRKFLEYGILSLLDDGQIIDNWIASSGQPGYQSRSAQRVRGKGIIPPYHGYRVDSAAVELPGVKGVEGSFYPILPYRVGDRGDFGIHFDANVPGSAGCIVIKNWKPWQEFRGWMLAQGGSEIPLAISYVDPK